MRNVGIALPLSALAFACSTTPETPSEPAVPHATAAQQSDAYVNSSAPATMAQQDGGTLQEQAERMTLAQQKNRFLVEQHIEQAIALRDRLNLEEAERELLLALEIDPDNLRAKELLSDVGAMLGRPPGTTTTITKQLSDEYQLRIQQLKAEAGDNLRKGKLALAREDYDEAIAELTLALNHIKWAPYSVNWEGLDTETAALLDQAKANRTTAQEETRKAAERDAFDALRNREQADRTRREAVVANMLDRSIAAFNSGRYDESMDFADQALRKAPRNEKAVELRDASFRAGREKVRTDYIERKREEFARWREHLQELEIPWTDVITYPDPDAWRDLTERRKGRRGLDLTQAVSESDTALRGQLASTNVVLPDIEDEESLRAIVDIIRQFTGLALIVDPAAENAVLDEGVVFSFNFEYEISVTQALNLITDQAGEEVTWTIRHDAVLVTTKEKARGAPIIFNHDVQDLILGLTDFTGPRIDRLRLLEELEDDDGGGPFGGIGESPRLIEIDDLAQLIQDNVAKGTWDEDGVSLEPGENFILVVHSPDIQAQVRDFLEDLRRFNSSLVTIESKFMTVGDNWLQEIGVDFRGLDSVNLDDVTNGLEDMASRGLDNGGTGSDGQGAAGPPSAGFFYDDNTDGDFRSTTQNFFGEALGEALSNIGGLTFQLTFLNDLEVSAILRAVEKSAQFELINSQMLSVHNTQRAYVTVINQQAYIQDYDVEVAQFIAVADPQINVIHEGVVLDVRPTIHHDRKYLTLEIQPTVAEVIALTDFSTTLGVGTPVEIQLPELEVQSVNTSAIIPDGGSILLGGLTSIRNIERRAEVPFLAKIPLIGFLFKQEGYDDERTSLMILIKARITDVREAVTQKLERRY